MAYISSTNAMAANFGVTLVATDLIITGYEINFGEASAGAAGAAFSVILTGFTGGNIYESITTVQSNQVIDFQELISKTGIKNMYVPGNVRLLYTILGGIINGSMTINMEYWAP